MTYWLTYRRNGEKWSIIMNAITTWNFENSTVRTLTINNEPYFVGKDVADVLGYGAARNAIAAHVDAEDKLTHQIDA